MFCRKDGEVVCVPSDASCCDCSLSLRSNYRRQVYMLGLIRLTQQKSLLGTFSKKRPNFHHGRYHLEVVPSEWKIRNNTVERSSSAASSDSTYDKALLEPDLEPRYNVQDKRTRRTPEVRRPKRQTTAMARPRPAMVLHWSTGDLCIDRATVRYTFLERGPVSASLNDKYQASKLEGLQLAPSSSSRCCFDMSIKADLMDVVMKKRASAAR
jgi:hypothetical protein